MTKCSIVRIAAILLIVALPHSSPSYAAKLRYTVRTGDGWKTVTTMLVSGKVVSMGQAADLDVEHTGTTEQKVLSTNADGSFVSSVSRKSGMKVKFGGIELDQPPAPPVNPFTINYSPFGKVVRVDGLEGQSGSVAMDIGLLLSAVLLELPAKEIGVGETWEIVKNVPVPITTKGKLVEITKKDGREVAKIEFTRVITGEDLNRTIQDITKPEQVMEWSGPGIKVIAAVTIDIASGVPILCDGKTEIDLMMKIGQEQFHYSLKGTINENTTK